MYYLMSVDSITGTFTALFTGGLVFFTWKLVKGQNRSTDEQLRIAREQMRVEIQLKLQDTFDSRSMMFTRRNLANQFIVKLDYKHIQEELMNYFETVGMLLKRKYADKEMIWIAFGYYGRLWWSACNDYILEVRRQQNDPTLFAEFEYLANELNDFEAKRLKKTRSEIELPQSQVDKFLKEERSII